MDTVNASVPQIYDAQKESELVLQGGTEATSQVSQSDNNQQLANSDILHGIPDLLPSTQQLTVDTTPVPAVHMSDDQSEPGMVLRDDTRAITQDDENPVSNQHQSVPLIAVKPRDIPSTKSTDNQQRPANSTHPADLGLPMQCNLCDKEISSKNFLQHCQTSHNIERPSLRQHAVVVSPKPDSIYQNYGKLKPGVVVVTEEGEYLTIEKPTITGWSMVNIHTKERKDLELINDMTGMRYIGMLHSQTEEGVNIVNDDNQLVFVEEVAYSKKIFFTAKVNYHEESVFVVNIPRSRHDEPACLDAKQKELRNYKNFDVFDAVDTDEATDNIIATEWVLIEKEKQDGTKVIKARLCLTGDMEESLHKCGKSISSVRPDSMRSLCKAPG